MTLLVTAVAITWPLLLTALVGFVLSRFRAWIAFLCVPVGAALGYYLITDMYEPSIHDSIQMDLEGHAASVHWLAALLAVGAPVAGAVLRRRATERLRTAPRSGMGERARP